MITEVRTGNYAIVESNTVYLYDKNSDLFLHFNENGFEFNVRFIFESKSDFEGQDLKREIIENTIEIKCINFDNELGTGTTKPIEIATIEGKKMYIHFWSFLNGQLFENKVARRVIYTVFMER